MALINDNSCNFNSFITASIQELHISPVVGC